MEQIEINGVLWDTKNLEVDGNKYFTWEQAMQIAKSNRKRLPTKEEFEYLKSTGMKFDNCKRDIAFANDSIFFRLEGFKDANHEHIWGNRNMPYLWTSSIDEVCTKKPYRFTLTTDSCDVTTLYKN